MGVTDEPGHAGEVLDGGEDLLAYQRMALHDGALLRVEWTRLVEDRLRYGDSADVVERRRVAQVAQV